MGLGPAVDVGGPAAVRLALPCAPANFQARFAKCQLHRLGDVQRYGLEQSFDAVPDDLRADAEQEK